ncbi:hypothetical protein AB1Y20_015042 [Prymnesium parvum]|uniref:GYF domain-containing protein n=1 Tax=Prymnesium parvum TaxID=97485 RepID=A0AB34JZI2_PRYPA
MNECGDGEGKGKGKGGGLGFPCPPPQPPPSPPPPSPPPPFIPGGQPPSTPPLLPPSLPLAPGEALRSSGGDGAIVGISLGMGGLLMTSVLAVVLVTRRRRRAPSCSSGQVGGWFNPGAAAPKGVLPVSKAQGATGSSIATVAPPVGRPFPKPPTLKALTVAASREGHATLATGAHEPSTQPTPTSWYYFNRNNQQQGPVTANALCRLYDNGTIHDHTYVWSAGIMSDWKELYQAPLVYEPVAFDDRTSLTSSIV